MIQPRYQRKSACMPAFSHDAIHIFVKKVTNPHVQLFSLGIDHSYRIGKQFLIYTVSIRDMVSCTWRKLNV